MLNRPILVVLSLLGGCSTAPAMSTEELDRYVSSLPGALVTDVTSRLKQMGFTCGQRTPTFAPGSTPSFGCSRSASGGRVPIQTCSFTEMVNAGFVLDASNKVTSHRVFASC